MKLSAEEENSEDIDTILQTSQFLFNLFKLIASPVSLVLSCVCFFCLCSVFCFASTSFLLFLVLQESHLVDLLTSLSTT